MEARNDLDAFDRLQGANNARDGAYDARLLTTAGHLWGGWIREDASVTRPSIT